MSVIRPGGKLWRVLCVPWSTYMAVLLEWSVFWLPLYKGIVRMCVNGCLSAKVCLNYRLREVIWVDEGAC